MPNTIGPSDPTARRPPPLPAEFACSWIHVDPDAVSVHVAGELDIATAPEFESTLREAQSRVRLVVLDLRELAFIDGTGVHAIVDAAIRARQAGCRLVLLRGPAHVERLFTLTATAGQLEFALADPAQPVVRDRPARRRRSSLASARAGFRATAAAVAPRNAASTLKTRACALVPWLRSAPSGELSVGPGADGRTTPRHRRP